MFKNRTVLPTLLPPESCTILKDLSSSPKQIYLIMPYLRTIRHLFAFATLLLNPVVFSTRQLLPAIKKDVLPAFQQSNIIYQYLCHCDGRFVDRTTQRLSNKIKQHVPNSIRTGQFSRDRSAICCSC